MRNPVQIAKQLWLKFPVDLAWDIFTMDCMLVVLLAVFVAGLASFDAEFSSLIDCYQRWLWASGIALAIVWLISVLRVIWPDERIGVADEHS